jgi:glyoxylase-like metal-dependent hydrolase (beta-lactamase superfamily II)
LSEWEVYALRYASHTGRTPHQNYLAPDPHDDAADLDYYVWLVRDAERAILVDTGFNEAAARERQRTLMIDPAEALRRFGVSPDDIGDVVITHLHYDHAGNLDCFPNARFHLQDREMAFATGRCMCHARLRHPFSVEDVTMMVRHVYDERAVFHCGDGEIAPGVTVHHIGGHSDGLQVVRVMTKRGPVVLASDATHFYANMQRKNPFPILYNMGDMFEGWNRLVQLAGDPERIIPGHDPLVRTLYPIASREVDAVSLHEPPKRSVSEPARG